MNQHLNLFKFFNDPGEQEFLENNLSRAFSLCLSHNSFFLSEYVRHIVSEADYKYLFGSISSDTNYNIDIQIDTETIEKVSYTKVYAVAMTTDRDLKMDDFFNQAVKHKKNITDILISIKDILIIIEVKRNPSDCREQLFNQVSPFMNKEDSGKYEVYPKNYSWQDVIKLMENVRNIQRLGMQNSVFISDFLEFSEIRYPDWFESKPFKLIDFIEQGRTPLDSQLMKRMRQALAGIAMISGEEYSVLNYDDRLAISVPFGWASEVIPEFDKQDWVVFNIWPGNTKQQGYHFFYDSLDWKNKKSLTVKDEIYNLNITYTIKLCHYNKYIAGINFSNDDILKDLHTVENFEKISGKWDWNNDTKKWQRGGYKDFDKLMSEYFKPEFKWKERCHWNENFQNSDRNYFTMAIGFEVGLCIRYSKFQSIDKSDQDIAKVTSFLIDILAAFETLIP